jgi:uncharacterized membrane protein
MKTIIISVMSSIVTMLAIDAVWLKTMFGPFYSKHMSSLITDTPRLIPAGIFYVIFAIVMVLSPLIYWLTTADERSFKKKYHIDE